MICLQVLSTCQLRKYSGQLLYRKIIRLKVSAKIPDRTNVPNPSPNYVYRWAAYTDLDSSKGITQRQDQGPHTKTWEKWSLSDKLIPGPSPSVPSLHPVSMIQVVYIRQTKKDSFLLCTWLHVIFMKNIIHLFKKILIDCVIVL